VWTLRCAAAVLLIFALLALALMFGCALAQRDDGRQDATVQDTTVQDTIVQEAIVQDAIVQEGVVQDEPVDPQEMSTEPDSPIRAEMSLPEVTAGPESESPAQTPEPEETVNPQDGWVYLRLNGAMLYSSKSMEPRREVGTVTGIALALHYVEDIQNAEGNRGGAIRAIFVTEDGALLDGIFVARDVQTLTYQEAIEAIGGNACRCFAENMTWPLPAAALVPVEREPASKPAQEAAEEATIEATPAPYVVITSNLEDGLTAGARVVLTAEVFHLDEDRIAGYRWSRNVEGEWQEVPGVTGNVCIFLASEENSGREYVVEVLLR